MNRKVLKYFKRVNEDISSLSDEIWNMLTFSIVFFIIVVLKYFDIYIMTENTVYSFTLAALLLSISQISKGLLQKIIYLLGFIVLIVGTNIYFSISC